MQELKNTRWNLSPGLVLPALAFLSLFTILLTGIRQPLSAQVLPPPPPDDFQEPAFRTSANYVLVDVSAKDSNEVPVGGLSEANFTVTDDGEPVEITRFTEGSTEISIVLAADYSGSMRPRRTALIRGVEQLSSLLLPQDETSLVLFNENPVLAAKGQAGEWGKLLTTAPPTGQTALYDAAILASDTLEDSMYQRRVAILLSDGEDTASMASKEKMFAALRRSGTLVYAIGLFRQGERHTDAGVLQELAERTGGQAFFSPDGTNLTQVFVDIVNDLRSRYVLMFPAADPPSDEDLIRKISVTARDSSGKKLNVSARKEYVVSGR